MIHFIILPTAGDQIAFRAGKTPENYLERQFDNKAEAEIYLSGIDTMEDLADYEILEEQEMSLLVSFDENDECNISFATTAQKKAYMKGLEDGDGFIPPEVYHEGSAEYTDLLESLTRKAA